jgi:hypothetical protein
MDIVVGNAGEIDTGETGWFIGYGDWTRELLHVPKEQAVSGLCVKWYEHPAGDASADSKPVSEGRSISILVSEQGAFEIEFSQSPRFEPEGSRKVLLQRRGDFVAWGDGIFHRWRCVSRSTILTVRWLSQPSG